MISSEIRPPRPEKGKKVGKKLRKPKNSKKASLGRKGNLSRARRHHMEWGVVVHQEVGEERQGEAKRKPTATAGLWCMTRGGGEIEGDRQTTANAGLWCMTRAAILTAHCGTRSEWSLSDRSVVYLGKSCRTSNSCTICHICVHVSVGEHDRGERA